MKVSSSTKVTFNQLRYRNMFYFKILSFEMLLFAKMTNFVDNARYLKFN